MKLTLAATVFAAVSLLSAPSAHASSGTITGLINFFQAQGNCGNVTGSKYSCSTQYNRDQPVQGAQVVVKRASDSVELGTNYTNPDGTFNVTWTDNGAGGNVAVVLGIRTVNVDGRFQVVSTPNSRWIFSFTNITGISGGNVNLGTRSVGNSPHFNVYDGARLQWALFKGSNRLNAFFGTPTIVQISSQGYNQSGTAGSCKNGNAWADGPSRWVCLSNDTTGQYANLSRVQHELGHIAEWVSNRDQTRTNNWADYTRDDPAGCTGTNCNTHQYNSSEYGMAQFQEAIADHWSAMGLYKQAVTAPFHCVSLSACDGTNGFNLESAPGNCANEQRWQITADRYLWDTYDTVVDSANGQTDNLSRGMTHYSDTMNSFGPGIANAQRDEPGTGFPATDKDGHNCLDWKNVWNNFGTDSNPQLLLNCLNWGD
jgi:hypothetical protein